MTYTVIRPFTYNGATAERGSTLADNVVEPNRALMALVKLGKLEKQPTVPLTMKPYPPSVGVERYEETHPRSNPANNAQYRQVEAPVEGDGGDAGVTGFAAPATEGDAPRAAAPADPAPAPKAARSRPAPKPAAAEPQG